MSSNILMVRYGKLGRKNRTTNGVLRHVFAISPWLREILLPLQ